MNKTIQTEIDACFLYQKLAEHEEDPIIVNVFRQMSDIEKSHAEAFAKKENIHIDYYELIAKYLSGNADSGEVKTLEEWVLASEENKNQFYCQPLLYFGDSILIQYKHPTTKQKG